jgi:hypothetical protein
MEQILKVRCPDLSLDTESLQQTYEVLRKNEATLVDPRAPELEEEDDEDDLVSLNEEVCTIDPVQENVTRWDPSSVIACIFSTDILS